MTKRRSIGQAQRQRIIERDGHKCRECGATNTNLEIDHVTEVHDGGTNDDENLQSLCFSCHARKTADFAHARAVRRKMRPQCGGPWLTPDEGPPPKKKKIPQRANHRWPSRKLHSRNNLRRTDDER